MTTHFCMCMCAVLSGMHTNTGKVKSGTDTGVHSIDHFCTNVRVQVFCNTSSR